MKQVRIARLGDDVQTLNLPDNATACDALRAADVDASGFEVRVNNQPVDMNANLEAGASIIVTPRIKAGAAA